jgi:hypothetical protein
LETPVNHPPQKFKPTPEALYRGRKENEMTIFYFIGVPFIILVCFLVFAEIAGRVTKRGSFIKSLFK